MIIRTSDGMNHEVSVRSGLVGMPIRAVHLHPRDFMDLDALVHCLRESVAPRMVVDEEVRRGRAILGGSAPSYLLFTSRELKAKFRADCPLISRVPLLSRWAFDRWSYGYLAQKARNQEAWSK
jgi:hypothetical protein